VYQLLDFVEGVHNNFSRKRAEDLLQRTKIPAKAKVRELSKGMVTQLHLSIITAIDAKLLILDEPTLGLDIIFRKDFYGNLLEDYFNEERTIIITTHQVEEIENLLTNLMFINDGRIVLDTGMDTLPEQFVELLANNDAADQARKLNPIFERDDFGKKVLTFEGVDREQLTGLGEMRTPNVADLFVAKVKGATA
jgi:ABC-2 type transport system ATP-binding protein